MGFSVVFSIKNGVPFSVIVRVRRVVYDQRGVQNSSRLSPSRRRQCRTAGQTGTGRIMHSYLTPSLSSGSCVSWNCRKSLRARSSALWSRWNGIFCNRSSSISVKLDVRKRLKVLEGNFKAVSSRGVAFEVMAEVEVVDGFDPSV